MGAEGMLFFSLFFSPSSPPSYLPAGEFVLAEAHLDTVAARNDLGGALDVSVQLVTLHPVDAPGTFARPQLQAGLLCVDREHRELRLCEGT